MIIIVIIIIIIVIMIIIIVIIIIIIKKRKNVFRICEIYYLWRFLLFRLVNSCVQIFTVSASLMCLALCSLCVFVES